VGQLATTLEGVLTTLRSQDPAPLIATAKTVLEDGIAYKITALREEFDKEILNFKTSFVTVSRAVGDRVGDLEVRSAGWMGGDSAAKRSKIEIESTGLAARLERVELKLLSNAMDEGSDEPTQSWKVGDERAVDVVERFEKKLLDLELKLGRVVAKGDERAISFAGLGFLKPAQANAWIEAEMPSHPAGLIVDIHVVLERIHHSMSNMSTLSVMQQLVKIKVQSIADGSAITSYDQKIPKFFSKSSGHRVVKDDASFLDLIPTWKDWDDAQTGYRMRLQDELVAFEAEHSEVIASLQEDSTKAYTVAQLALTESIAWMHGFISFIDGYYRDLTKAKFGTGKAWHVTTRLAKRMLDDIAAARQGVQGSFVAGDPIQVCQKVVWGVLKAHDVMSAFKKHGFKHHPAVASELVKFLAVNTSFEIIERLDQKVLTMDKELNELKKSVAGALKTAGTVGNSNDAFKLSLTKLEKRMTTLESRK
jgi:hypothetical protein